MNTTRRSILSALVLGSTWLTSATACRAPAREHAEYRTIAERLVRMSKERRALRSIGMAYLTSSDERYTAEMIAAAWFPSEAERRRALGQKPLELAAHMADRTRADYRHDRVVNVRGWLLSETEARFAALTALLRRV
ncbi:MAG TPA: hypothetical protein VFU02_08900 [Polyangiaceae bacterium]|nr:hypothetical protein [Polyangiaceae bacterium]